MNVIKIWIIFVKIGLAKKKYDLKQIGIQS